MEKIQAEFKYGWRPDLPDIRDLRYSASMETINTLPSKVDLRKNCPPILNQIPFNSCTANAIAVAHQFEQIKQRAKANFTPSRLFIYYNEREIEGTVDYDSGAYLRDGFKSIAKQGVCPETMWPYEIEKFATKPSNDCYADALDHQVLRYLGVEQSENHLKACLAEGYPFVFGFQSLFLIHYIS
jgi:C1A family cysteine protease